VLASQEGLCSVLVSWLVG